MKRKNFKTFVILLLALTVVACGRMNPVREFVDVMNSGIEDIDESPNYDVMYAVCGEMDERLDELNRKYNDYKLTDKDRERLYDVITDFYISIIVKSAELEGVDMADDEDMAYFNEVYEHIESMARHYINNAETFGDTYQAIQRLGNYTAYLADGEGEFDPSVMYGDDDDSVVVDEEYVENVMGAFGDALDILGSDYEYYDDDDSGDLLDILF